MISILYERDTNNIKAIFSESQSSESLNSDKVNIRWENGYRIAIYLENINIKIYNIENKLDLVILVSIGDFLVLYPDIDMNDLD